SGTATPGTDYSLSAPDGHAVIPAGQPSVTVSLTPLEDSLAEPAETAVLTLQAPPGAPYTVGSPSSVAVIIADGNSPTPLANPNLAFLAGSADPTGAQAETSPPAVGSGTDRDSPTPADAQPADGGGAASAGPAAANGAADPNVGAPIQPAPQDSGTAG